MPRVEQRQALPKLLLDPPLPIPEAPFEAVNVTTPGRDRTPLVVSDHCNADATSDTRRDRPVGCQSMDEKPFPVEADVPGIQRWIVGGFSELKLVRGGSLLLEELLRARLPGALDEVVGPDNWERIKIVSGGLLIRCEDEQTARNAAKTLAKLAEHQGAEDQTESWPGTDDVSVRVLLKTRTEFGFEASDLRLSQPCKRQPRSN